MNLSIDYNISPPLAPISGFLQGTLDFHLLELLYAIGLLTTASYPCEFDLAYQHAFYRYLWLPAGPGPLKIRRAIEDVDFHQKTLISDELGVGVAGLAASRLFGVRYFADAYPILKQKSRASGFRLGPQRKYPDFIGLDMTGRFFVIEAKGTQTQSGLQSRQIQSGVIQKASVVFSGQQPPTRIVIATRFAREAAGHRASSTRIVDPKFHGELTESDRRLVLQEHFLKLLSSIGVVVRREALEVGKYHLDISRCDSVEVMKHAGMGREFRFQAMRPIGEKETQPNQAPRWYRLRLGVLAETLAAMEAFKSADIAERISSKEPRGIFESSTKTQQFRFISPEGWMLDLEAEPQRAG